MALDYEKAFKVLEEEITNGTKWAKEQEEEYEEKHYKNPESREYNAHMWYSNGVAWAYEYFSNYLEAIKANPYLQRID